MFLFLFSLIFVLLFHFLRGTTTTNSSNTSITRRSKRFVNYKIHMPPEFNRSLFYWPSIIIITCIESSNRFCVNRLAHYSTIISNFCTNTFFLNLFFMCELWSAFLCFLVVDVWLKMLRACELR